MKALAQKLVSYRAIGAPMAHLLGMLGQTHKRSRVLHFCGYMPSEIPVTLPENVRRNGGGRRFKLTSAEGTDQIAWRLWSDGWGGFERPLSDMFLACSQNAKVVFDIGANAGLYALMAASAWKEVAVYAFEPLPVACRHCRNNIQLNHLQNQIVLEEAAVAEQSGTAELFVPAGNEGLLEMSASLNQEFRPQHSEVLRVPLVSVDDYVRKHSIARLDVLKVDVESQEHRVLEGSDRTLASLRPYVFLEVLENSAVDKLDPIRRKHDYVVVRLQEGVLRVVSQIAFDPLGVNQLLIPSERLNELQSLASTWGYQLLQARVPARQADQVAST